MISLDNLTVSYGGWTLFDGISFLINEKDRIGLVGKNGAGKTTTMQSIIGLIPSRHGSVTFDGQDITKMPCHKIVHAGLTQVPEGRKPTNGQKAGD